MLMVSELLGREVRDDDGRCATLVDLVVNLLGGDHRSVTSFVIEHAGRRSLLPSPRLRRVGEQILVADLGLTEPADDDVLADLVLLGCHVMDALVLDLDSQRTVRVNDVALEHTGEVLARGEIDATPWAVIRRVFGRRLAIGRPHALIDWRDVEFLRGDPSRSFDGTGAESRATRLTPAQVADLADALPYMHAAELLNILPCAFAADVFEVLSPERQVQVLSELPPGRAVAILAEASPDHVADVLARLSLAEATDILERLPRERAELVTELLRYPADSAGGIMTNEVVVVPCGLSVREAIDAIRPQLERPDLVYFVYVVADSESHRLAGVMTLRDLLLAEPHRPVSDVMNMHLITADPLEPAREVAYRLADNQLNALPVVARDGRLLGIVTIDNAIIQIAPGALQRDLPRIYA